MSRVVALCCTTLLVACAPSGEQAATTDTTVATPPAVSLADVAGTWDMKTMLVGSDSVVATSRMIATGTMEGWVLNLEGRDPIPMRVVSVDGDSIVTEAGPFESILRPGVMVSIRSVSRLEHGMLMGAMVARYQTTAADSVVTLRSEGTRTQM